MKVIFKERLKELRLEKGLTQKQLGAVFNLRQFTISDWETRGCEPNYQMLVELATYFGVTTDYLLGKEN